MFSHPIADMFTEGGVKFFYPLSKGSYDFSRFSFGIPLKTGETGYVISTGGVGLTIYFLMILSVIFVEDFIKVLKRIRKPEEALIKTIEEEGRKVEKEL